MTRFLAALLVATGPAVKAVVDPRVKDAGDLGPDRSSALLAQAVTGPRRERAGIEMVRRAGREGWEIHQRRKAEEGTS